FATYTTFITARLGDINYRGITMRQLTLNDNNGGHMLATNRIHKRTSEQGFTLIELSIVLVIIGLIVGGVLVGQDLIRAAAVRAQISQIEKYQTAVNTFRGKYGGLPGDLSASSAAQFGFVSRGGSTGQGDGNGVIQGYSASYGASGDFEAA